MSPSFFAIILSTFFPFLSTESSDVLLFKKPPSVVETNNGIVLYVDGFDYDWKNSEELYTVLTPCGNKNKVSVKNTTAVFDIDVLIDPGHGGDNYGAGSAVGVLEKDLNLSLAKLVSKKLNEKKISNLLLRKGDYNQKIWWRGKIAKELSPKLFISLHHNGGPNKKNSKKPGTEVYYQFGSEEGKRAGGILYKEVFSLLKTYDEIENWWSSKKPGVKYILSSKGSDFFGILRNSTGVTTVLLESAFISNPAEAKILTNKDFKIKHAEAITNGIDIFLHTNNTGSGFVKQTQAQSKRKTTYLDYYISPCRDPVLE